MEIALVILKNTQQIICEIEEGVGQFDDADFICHNALLVGWQPNRSQPDPKKAGLVLALSEYPALVIHLVEDSVNTTVKVAEMEVRALYREKDLRPEVKADYQRRKQEVYGKLAIVHTLPGALTGRA